MPLDIATVLSEMVAERQFSDMMNNMSAQFGAPTRPYLGATLLPEKTVPENIYEEDGIRYRSIVANDGTRYSPVQIKRGMKVGSFLVRLGYQDIGVQMTAKDYDVFTKLLKQASNRTGGAGLQAMFALLNFVDTQMRIPLIEKIEVQRWQALLKALIKRRGDNGYVEDVAISNPAGSRVAASDWSDDNIDPYDDLTERVEYLKGKGYTCTRIITDTPSLNLLLRNQKIRERLGQLVILGGTAVGMRGRATLGEVNAKLAEDKIPPIETYDLQYQTDLGSDYFFERGNMIFCATTGRDEILYLGIDQAPVVIPDTFGYVGIGTPTGVDSPQRVVHVKSVLDTKPPHIGGEAWQASFPVVTEPEAVTVLTDIGD